jgi:hypothetical protein
MERFLKDFFTSDEEMEVRTFPHNSCCNFVTDLNRVSRH